MSFLALWDVCAAYYLLGFLIAVKTPDDCSVNCYRAIAATILSCFASVENMASVHGFLLHLSALDLINNLDRAGF